MSFKKPACVVLAVLMMTACVSCAKKAMPEPRESFDSIRDYAAWAQNVGYSSGALADEGFYGINQDRFCTGPGAPGYDSGRIVIGDSRCCQLGIYALRAGADKYAVFAVWGGHYTEREPFIPTDGFYSSVEECFRAQVGARGFCKLFFFATVNDYDHIGDQNGDNIAAAIACAERLASMKCVHNGREVRPEVTVIGIEGGGSSVYLPENFNRCIESYNEALEAAVRGSAVLASSAARYTTVPALTGGAGFIDDGLHYDDDTLRILAEFIIE